MIVREIEEEIGIKVDVKSLKKLFTNKGSFKRKDIFNQEFEEVFLLETNKSLTELTMQPQEVDGVYEANINDMIDLVICNKDRIVVNAYHRNEDNRYSEEKTNIDINSLIPHGKEYYLKIMTMINDVLNGEADISSGSY